jgi:transglutaminase-like putative cysteine protease
VNTPPGLVGVALLFWGWQTGLLLFAVPMALVLEGARVAAWRWDLSAADARRIADLCRIVLIAMAVYLLATRGAGRGVLGLIEWFPLAVLPLLVCQAYGSADRIDLRTFFLILRRQAVGEGEAVNLAYPYLAVLLGAASAANVRTPAFYVAVCMLGAWGLWPARSRAFPWPVWAGVLGVAAGAGYVGHLGLHEMQDALEAVVMEFISDPARRETDPFRSRTAIGAIGRLKLSDRILVRVDPGGPPVPEDGPLLLHEAAYNVYTASVWGATDAPFDPVPPQLDRRTWDLLPGVPPGRASREVGIALYTRRGRGMVLLPNGAFRVEGLLALQMKKNRLGAVKVEEGLGLATYRARFAPGMALGGPPDDEDVQVPRQEAPVVARIASDLGLADRPPREALEVVARYFRSGFRYATYLEGARRGSTALEDFFLRSRAGHCEYYATATVLLLRAAGIPARYATGWSVQEWSSREGRYLVRARHGHAWALAWVDGAWRDFDTTPPVWVSAEAAGASVWEPLYDLGSWAMFLFSRWRFSDQDPTYLRYAGWLLVPLSAFLGWRLYRSRRVARAATSRAAGPARSGGPGEDSEFYQVERALAARGLGRRPWEPVGRWLGRVRAAPLAGVGADALAALAALHNRHRFDPKGLSAAERTALRAGVEAWLAPQPAERGG